MAALLDQIVLTARFQPGASALGHHWVVTDADDREIGRTRRAYPGGVAGRLLRRTAVATGFTGEDIAADLVGADGRPVARLASNAKQKRVDVTGPDGSPVGSARRVTGEGITLEQPDGQPAGSVPIAAGARAPWPVLDAAGATVGALVLTKAQRVAPMSLLTLVGVPDLLAPVRDFQRTMFMGFADSKEYGMVMEQRPDREPLRTLAVLLPVICAVCY